MESAFTITVGEFRFECLTDSLKGAWDVIWLRPSDQARHQIGVLTLRNGAVDLQQTMPGPQGSPSPAQMDEFICQCATEARRRREAAAAKPNMTYDAKQTAKSETLRVSIETIAALVGAALEQSGFLDQQADTLKAIAAYTEIAQRLNAELAADHVD